MLSGNNYNIFLPYRPRRACRPQITDKRRKPSCNRAKSLRLGYDIFSKNAKQRAKSGGKYYAGEQHLASPVLLVVASSDSPQKNTKVLARRLFRPLTFLFRNLHLR